MYMSSAHYRQDILLNYSGITITDSKLICFCFVCCALFIITGNARKGVCALY